MSNPSDPNASQPQPSQPDAPAQPAAPQYTGGPAQPAPPQYAGAPAQPAAPQYAANPAPPTNTLSVISMISSIVGVFTFGVLSILGVILGHVGLNQIKRTGEGGRGFALTGLIVGYVAIALYVIGLLIVLALIPLFVVAGTATSGY